MGIYYSRHSGRAIDAGVERAASALQPEDVDAGLALPGKAADAKVVGDKFAVLSDGVSIGFSADTAPSGRSYGTITVAGKYTKNTYITVTNTSNAKLFFTLEKEGEGGKQEFQCQSDSSCTVRIKYDSGELSVYSNSYPISGTVRVSPVIDLIRGYADARDMIDTRVLGFDRIISADHADNGNSDHGNIRVDGFFCKGQTFTLANLNDRITNGINFQFRSAQDEVIYEVTVPYGGSGIVRLDSGEVSYLNIYTNAFPIKCGIYSPPIDKALAEYTQDYAGMRDVIATRLYGFDKTLNASRADNGRTDYGSIRVDGYFYKGQTFTLENLNDQITNGVNFQFRSGDEEIIKETTVPLGETKTVVIDSDSVRYLRVFSNAFPMKCRIYSQPVDELLTRQLSADIVTLNGNVRSALKNAVKKTSATYTPPVCLLHFSDIHGDAKNLKRIIEMSAYLGDGIDDTICTGDMVNDEYGPENMDFWRNTEGSENILACIGNHDVHEHGDPDYSSDEIGQAAAYSMYFAPAIENWGVEASENITYYYKDYPEKKIRLIVLNYLLTGSEQTAQNTWLASCLSGAASEGYTVVIAEHAPPNSAAKIDCDFSARDKTWDYDQFPVLYQSTVQDHIDNGGKFACYLCGHSHWDMISRNPDYPDQLFITVTCAYVPGTTNTSSDQHRANGEKSQDAANLTVIDTNSRTIKLIRVGADMDCYLRPREYMSISYADGTICQRGGYCTSVEGGE